MKLEHKKHGEHDVLEGEVSLDDPEGLRNVFDAMWASQCRQTPEQTKRMFDGLDASREGFLLVFDDEQTFVDSSDEKQGRFFDAMRFMTKKTLAEERLYEANGMSFFSMWAAAAVKEQIELKEHLEEKFAELRLKHDL